MLGQVDKYFVLAYSFSFFVRITVNNKSIMNKKILAGIFLSISGLSYGQDDAVKYANTITPEDLKKHLVIIASDSLEGRDTGSPGQKKAAEYVTKYFKEYGLTPIATAEDGSKSYYPHRSLLRYRLTR